MIPWTILVNKLDKAGGEITDRSVVDLFDVIGYSCMLPGLVDILSCQFLVVSGHLKYTSN